MQTIDYLKQTITSGIKFMSFSEPEDIDNKSFPNEIVDIIKNYGANFLLNGQEIHIHLDYHDFNGLVNNGIEISNDGAGNTWVVEVNENLECEAVYFCCHDPAYLEKQSDSLYEFFQQVIRDEVLDIEGTTIEPIKEIDPNLLNEFSIDEKSKLKEKVLIDFSSNMTAGDSFDWDEFGANTIIVKHKKKEMWLLMK
ncbi:hypothetical protein [Flammeovirga sp. SJP92]|uniref:hypothetical protein n=1 Tax=Flammeovirga sp. SJP92 TaxID=1775430 RepID=UPI0007869C13|nr:hypothetical protein [Flammeovirga sp. SJP92]KXX71308.1 hypothetical protein AVL50_06790 [Flammeovirga sp. SJP92]